MNVSVAHRRLQYLIVTSNNVNEADGLLQKNVAGWGEQDYTAKMEFLKKNFRFSIGSRFTLESEKDKIAKEDYFATLQYLISEASDFGIETVVRQPRMAACAV